MAKSTKDPAIDNLNQLLENYKQEVENAQNQNKVLWNQRSVALASKNTSQVKIIDSQRVALAKKIKDLQSISRNLKKIKSYTTTTPRTGKSLRKDFPDITQERKDLNALSHLISKSRSFAMTGDYSEYAKNTSKTVNVFEQTLSKRRDADYQSSIVKQHEKTIKNQEDKVKSTVKRLVGMMDFRKEGYTSQSELYAAELKKVEKAFMVKSDKRLLPTTKVKKLNSVIDMLEDRILNESLKSVTDKVIERESTKNQKQIDKLLDSIYKKQDTILSKTDYTKLGYQDYTSFRQDKQANLASTLSGTNTAPELQKILDGIEEQVTQLKDDKITSKYNKQEETLIEREIRKLQSVNEKLISTKEKNDYKTLSMSPLLSQMDKVDAVLGNREALRQKLQQDILNAKSGQKTNQEVLEELKKMNAQIRLQTEREALASKFEQNRKTESFLEGLFSNKKRGRGAGMLSGITPNVSAGGVGINLGASTLGAIFGGPVGAVVAPLITSVLGPMLTPIIGTVLGGIFKKSASLAYNGVKSILGFGTKASPAGVVAQNTASVAPKSGGILSKIAKGGGGILSAGISFGTGIANGESVAKAGTGATGAGLGALGGAAAGASIGALAGPIGSAVGGVLGGIFGGIGGEKLFDEVYDYFTKKEDQPKKVKIRKPPSTEQDNVQKMKDVMETHTTNKLTSTIVSASNQSNSANTVVNNNSTTIINGVDPSQGMMIAKYNSGYN